MTKPLLETRELEVVFGRSDDAVRALDGVSISIAREETLGIVGESGSGKTTLARVILGLQRPTSGTVRMDGVELGPTRTRSERRRIQVVFQDPGSSLDPRQRIGAAVAEPLRVHRAASRREGAQRVATLLERCGLPAETAERFPHELSGGQRQRVAIARAVVLEPDLLVCDEPTSALDVSVQAQILDLLAELRAAGGMACLFITHDLAVIANVADRLAVMRAGAVEEAGATTEVVTDPQTAYTQRLLAAVPRLPTTCR